ncbi:MAG: ABC transporter ATP-binding protein [Chloroflexota bacterium]
MSKPLVVETIDLTKTYDGTTAVDRLNLSIEEGEVFGLLGPNGAGKTTTILMLLGLTEPTSGEVRVCGYNSTREALKVKRLAGYVPEKVGFYDDLTARDNITYTARLNSLPEEQIPPRINEALKVVGLAKDAERTVNEFSSGMRQRLAIADLLVKAPKVAILDEPTLGIDVEGIGQILDLIVKIARERQMTIIMSSHQLSQVQRICNRVGIMAKGKMVAEGLIDELGKKALGGGQFIIEVQLSEITQKVTDSIQRIKGVVSVERSGELLLISCQDDVRPEIAKTIVDSGGLLTYMKIQSYALEDIYMKYSREA